MSQDPYVAFMKAKGNAFSAVLAWLGSVLGPSYILLGWGKYNEWPLYAGTGLIFLVLVSIKRGFKSLGRGERSDFIVYGLVPILIPAITGALLWSYNA